MIDEFRVKALIQLQQITKNSALIFETLIFKNPNFLKP